MLKDAIHIKYLEEYLAQRKFISAIYLKLDILYEWQDNILG